MNQLKIRADQKKLEAAKGGIAANIAVFINGYPHCKVGQANATAAILNGKADVDNDESNAKYDKFISALASEFRSNLFTTNATNGTWDAGETNMNIDKAKIAIGPYFNIPVPTGGQAWTSKPNPPKEFDKYQTSNIKNVLNQFLNPQVLSEQLTAKASSEVGNGAYDDVANPKKINPKGGNVSTIHWIDVVEHLALREGVMTKYKSADGDRLNGWHRYFTVEPHAGDWDDSVMYKLNDKNIKLKENGAYWFLSDMGYILNPPSKDSLIDLTLVDVWDAIATN